MIDITNPEHADLLLKVCHVAKDYRREQIEDWAKEASRRAAIWGGFYQLVSDTLVVFLDPAQAAELIRQLVEMVGVKRCAFPYPGLDWMTCCRIKGHDGPHAHCIGNDGFECVSGECATEDVMGDRCAPDPMVIARLLSLPPSAGAEAVLQALRGEK